MDFISKKDLKELSQTNVWKSLGQIFFDYLCIAVYISIGIYFSNVFVTLLMMLLIASRQKTLGVTVHDAIHYRLCNNKRINEWIVNLLVTYPVFASTTHARARHLQHHQETNTENDPDYYYKKDDPEYQFPQKKLVFLKNILKYIFPFHWLIVIFDSKKTFKEKLIYFYRGISAYRQVSIVEYPDNRKERMYMYIYNFFLLSFIIYNGWFWYYLIYYILPLVIFVPMLLRVSGICEHFGVTKTEIEASRTMYPKWWDYLFLGYGWGISYHLDHHLYPSVPSHNIKKLHKVLLQNEEFRNKAHITPDGTWGLFKECTI